MLSTSASMKSAKSAVLHCVTALFNADIPNGVPIWEKRAEAAGNAARMEAKPATTKPAYVPPVNGEKHDHHQHQYFGIIRR